MLHQSGLSILAAVSQSEASIPSPGLALALVITRAPVAALLLCAQQLQEYLVYLLCEATIIVLGV